LEVVFEIDGGLFEGNLV